MKSRPGNHPAGVCRFCGCSEFDACVVDDWFDVRGCSWTDVSRRVCSVCAPAQKAEGRALNTLREAGYAYAGDSVRVFHRGFIVGWFAVSARSPYGRNPYSVHSTIGGVWKRGAAAGANARRIYVQTFGPILNAPRRAVLVTPASQAGVGRVRRLPRRRRGAVRARRSARRV